MEEEATVVKRKLFFSFFPFSLFFFFLFSLSLSLIEEEAAVVRRSLYLMRGKGRNDFGSLRNAEGMFQKGLPHNRNCQGPGVSPQLRSCLN